MKLATWNINGTRARLDLLLAYLREASPDVLCLQEIKCTDEAFPREVFEEAGYTTAVHGQKGFNGVAILSKAPLSEIRRGLPEGDGDQQARYVEAMLPLGDTVVRVASIYLPNGNPIGTPKFTYKMAWMARLASHARALLADEVPTVLGGDLNVILEPEDARRPEEWVRDALYQPESRSALRALINLGYTDAVRACHPEPEVYTFWDYQSGAWQKNDGIRIDHLLLSPDAADRLRSAGIDKHTRGWEKPSDHVPVWVELGG